MKTDDMRIFPDPRECEARARLVFRREVEEIPEAKDGKVYYPMVDGIPCHPDPAVEAMRQSELASFLNAAARTLPHNAFVGDTPVLGLGGRCAWPV